MATSEEIRLQVIADVMKAAQDLGLFKKSLDDTGKSSKNLGLTFTELNSKFNLISSVASKVYGVFKSFVDQTEEAALAEQMLENTLKATSYAAGMTAEECKALASSLQNVSTFGDEAILSGENILLTFNRIGRDVFPQATQAMVDMAAFMQTDVSSAAHLLGKALQDPLEGMGALQRAGVRLTDSQEQMIKGFLSSGDILSAQKLILKEVEARYGGAANAASQTMGGALKQLQNRLGDLVEDMGKNVTPAVTTMIRAFNTGAKDSSFLSEAMIQVSNIVSKVALGIATVANVVGLVTSKAKEFYYETKVKDLRIELDALELSGKKNTTEFKNAKEQFDEYNKSLKQSKSDSKTYSSELKNINDQIYAIESGMRDATKEVNKTKGWKPPTYSNKQLTEEAKKRETEYQSFIAEGKASELVKLKAHYDKLISEHGGNTEKRIKIDEAYKQRATKIEEEIFLEKLKYAQAGIQAFATISNSITGIINQISQMQMTQLQNRQAAEDEAMQKRIDDNQAEYDKKIELIDQEKISEQDKKDKKEKLEKEKLDKEKSLKKEQQELEKKQQAEMKKLQHEIAVRQKATSIVSAIISTAQAVAGALACPPMPGSPWNIALASIIGALGLTQVGLIASTPIPAQTGGIIPASPGGTLIRAGEHSRSEAIIPLEDSGVMGKMGGNVYITVENLYGTSDLPEKVARMIDMGLARLHQDNNSTFAKRIQ